MDASVTRSDRPPPAPYSIRITAAALPTPLLSKMFDANPLTTEGTVSANRESVQVYFRTTFANQVHFPLVAGRSFAAHIVPNRAVVLYPREDLPDWPLRVPHPNESLHRLQTDTTPMEDITDVQPD